MKTGKEKAWAVIDPLRGALYWTIQSTRIAAREKFTGIPAGYEEWRRHYRKGFRVRRVTISWGGE